MKVILIGATTICGRISPAGYGSLLDRRRLEETRDKTGASLMGANTLRTENPEMRGTNGTLSAERIRAVISRSGLIPVENKKLFDQGPKPVLFTAGDSMFDLQGRLKGKARVVPLPEGKHGLSIRAALDFFADRGMESVLIEGGAQLNYAALAEGVVDEIMLTVMPFISGRHGAAAFADGPKHLGDPFLQLELLSCEQVSTGELFLQYHVRKMA